MFRLDTVGSFFFEISGCAKSFLTEKNEISGLLTSVLATVLFSFATVCVFVKINCGKFLIKMKYIEPPETSLYVNEKLSNLWSQAKF